MKNLIDAIENEIFDKTCEAHDNGDPEPRFKIVFSKAGYWNARNERVTTVYFDLQLTTFIGYPFEVSNLQKEEFTLQELD